LFQSTLQVVKFAANIEFLSDQYLTLSEEVQSILLKEKGSKFYGFAVPVTNEDQIPDYLIKIKKLHPKASHHCFAFRLGKTKNHYRASDDGEPSGTAGLPILGQIDSAQLTNTLVVIVRYFGGTKLGTAGLVKTYKATAKLTLDQGIIIPKYWTKAILIEINHQFLNPVLNFLKKYPGIEIIEMKIDLICQIKFFVRENDCDFVIQHLSEWNPISIA
jgi:uncharacterized YigZ family protein